MKNRPFCLVLMALLLFQSFRQAQIEVPASSIFYENEAVENAALRGQVYKKEQREEYQILYLKNNSITYQNHIYEESRIMIYDDSFEQVKIGQFMNIEGDLKRFEEAANPGNFDAQKYYAKENMHGKMWIKGACEVWGQGKQLQESLYECRQIAKQTIMKYMGEGKSSILTAMLLGEKGGIDEETKELYQKNGYGHILTISGLHISFIGLGIYHLLRKAGVGYGLGGVLSVGILLLYVIMIGFSVSVFRAFLMLLLRIGADMSGRVYDILTALLLSASIIVSYNPLYLSDASFQLSYGAILAILFVAPACKKVLGDYGKKSDSFYVSLAVQLALFPITLWWYYEISTYGILWNLLIIPLMSILMTTGVMGVILPMKNLWFSICSMILSVFEWIGQVGNRLPGSRIVLGRPSVVAVIVFYVWLCIFVWLSKYEVKYRKGILLGLAVAVLLFVKVPNGKVEITMLDVGQGECIYIKGPYGKDYLFDGGSSSVNQVGKYRIESFLKYKGVGSLEAVFLSHGDMDHCNGIEELLKRQEFGVKIHKLILADNFETDSGLESVRTTAVENKVEVYRMTKSNSIKEGEMCIRCLGPAEKNLEGNAGSMVLELTFKQFSMIFTGDVEAEGEEQIIDEIIEPYALLIVSHHGSKNGTTESFLAKTRPKLALISAGANNSYGHPHEEVLKRLNQFGSKVLCTAEVGAITVKTNGNSLTF